MAQLHSPFALTLLLLTACGDKPSDGADDTDVTAVTDDADGDGYTSEEDCDDSDADVHPGASEACDGVDNDCNGEIDEGVQSTFYVDTDGDGFGSDAGMVEACEAPSGFVDNAGDCDDSDAAYNPGATEDDCADPNDDNCDGSVGYADADGDGYAACEDCNDAAPAIHPGATEICDEADVDEDCDGLSDDADDSVDPDSQGMYHTDADTDGYGDASGTGTRSCEVPSGMVADNTDCDDTNIDVNPGAAEVCDADDTDEDCDGVADDDDAGVDTSTLSTWYLDDDSDGYGDSAVSTSACEQPSGHVADGTDCDDLDSAIHPGATEVCDPDNTDEDCSGTADDADSGVDTSTQTTWYTDSDADGYGDLSDAGTLSCDMPSGMVADNTDCDDTRIDVNPGAAEVCDTDDADEDCDGVADDDDAGVDTSTLSTWYLDDDSDGYGDSAVSTSACEQPSGHVADGTDCDDLVAAVNPGATEVCDDADVDEDCSGLADDADTGVDVSTLLAWYVDSDGDGYGEPGGTATMQCDAPSGLVADATDCDDTDAATYPSAAEVCDDADNDCDGDVDEGVVSTLYLDGDGDFFGDSSASLESCLPVAGYVGHGGDCDDDDDTVHPYAWEVDADGIDNDCDGDADADDTSLVTAIITTGDDTSSPYTPTNPAWSFPFCDSARTSFSVQSNGQIMFGFSHADFSESIAEFLSDGASIAMPWDDYYPTGSGEFYVVEHADAIGVYARDVSDCCTRIGGNTFAVVMHQSGMMHFAVDDKNSADHITGWSCGDDATVPYTDLSREIDGLAEGAFGLEAGGARAHYEYSSSGFDLEGYRWMMCGTDGTDADGDGWSGLCGDTNDSDAGVYPGSSSGDTGL